MPVNFLDSIQKFTAPYMHQWSAISGGNGISFMHPFRSDAAYIVIVKSSDNGNRVRFFIDDSKGMETTSINIEEKKDAILYNECISFFEKMKIIAESNDENKKKSRYATSVDDNIRDFCNRLYRENAS